MASNEKDLLREQDILQADDSVLISGEPKEPHSVYRRHGKFNVLWKSCMTIVTVDLTFAQATGLTLLFSDVLYWMMRKTARDPGEVSAGHGITCIGLSLLLFGGGILLILLTTFGGLMQCPTLNGAVVFCLLISTLSLSLGCLCCCYHWVKDDDDLPFAIFCVGYCFLMLFMCITVAGTVVVFTRIHPVGSDQPPPGIPLPNTPSNHSQLAAGAKDCAMVELPLGILVICYILSIAFVVMAYMACIMALGATSDIPPL